MRLFFSLMAGVICSACSFGMTLSLNTGVAAWTQSGPNGGAVFNIGSNPNIVWIGAPAGSQWISWAPDGGSLSFPGGLAGDFIYSLEIPASLNQWGGSLTLQLAADDYAALAISGTNAVMTGGVAAVGNPGYYALNAGGSYTFGPGLVTLLVTVTNYASGYVNNPTGLLAIGTAELANPEPSTFGMLVLGAAGLLAARIRRNE